MRYIIAILGFVLVTMMLWDAFEVIILPRGVSRRLSNDLLISLPPWFRISETPDSWQISNCQTPILSIATENSAIQETNGKRFAEV